jgi:hypothetical protein
MSIKEAKQWIEQFREVAHNAAEKAERARERLIHAEADGDEVLAACLRQHVKAADQAAQDVHVACDQMEKELPD